MTSGPNGTGEETVVDSEQFRIMWVWWSGCTIKIGGSRVR